MSFTLLERLEAKMRVIENKYPWMFTHVDSTTPTHYTVGDQFHKDMDMYNYLKELRDGHDWEREIE